ncbi:helix-hairpin-helix domain-containing protein [Nibrella saemangeumensis]|uniref:Helix-hairpin-helix domain-containing protein n=1 Tax=Nibrella saemangeumensis TaxID=1084526 RepID=A0ABP8MSL8_9BACT
MPRNVFTLIRDYFGLSHKEATGFLVVLLITSLFLVSPLLYRYFVPDTVPDTSAADQRRLDSLVALMKIEKVAGPYDREESEKTIAERYNEPSRSSGRLFPFNPNTATVAKWQALGLPPWLAQRIERYRSKGGQFRKKEDLRKIYDFPPALYERLEPYIQLPEQTATPVYASRTPTVERSFDRTPEVSTTRPAAKPALVPFDINTADTTELKLLKGIGSKLAARIVKFRDALGGFVSEEQYRDIFGLDSLALEEMHRYAQVKSSVQKLNINTATAEELDKHMYISFRQAQVIVNYRNQHGLFASLESLKPIRVLDAKTIEKLGPYLAF